MSKQVNYNENLCAGAAIRDDKGRRISKLFEASHPKMTVGYAKNLIMPDNPTEQEFNFRQSGGGVIEDGVAVIDKVKGNSVVWNQLLGGEYGVSETELIPNDVKIIEGHKYLVNSSKGDDAEAKLYLYFRKDGVSDYYCVVGYNMRIIFTAIANGDASKGANVEGGLWFYKAQTAPTPMRIFLTDLTQMFGAGNEPTTYEEFLSRKPFVEDEYAYNEGTIVNNKVEKVKSIGVNLWDEETRLGYYDEQGVFHTHTNQLCSVNPIHFVAGQAYYTNQGFPSAAFFAKDGTFIVRRDTISVGIISIPTGAAYMHINIDAAYGPTYNHDICINLSDPTINGQYFPYEKHELDLSWVKDIKDGEGVKLFEDGMKSAGTAFDEVRKDKAVKRLGDSFDLYNLSWTYHEESGCIYAILDSKAAGLYNIKCSKYETSSAPYWGVSQGEGTIIGNVNHNIYIKDSSITSADIVGGKVEKLRGVLVNYELATPIEVEYDEKNLTYPVIAGGTEEAIASEPSSAFRADIGYGIDAVKTILDLKARVEALEAK